MLGISLFIWVVVSVYLFVSEDNDGPASLWVNFGGMVISTIAIYTGATPAWTILVSPIIISFLGTFYSFRKMDYNDNPSVGTGLSFLISALFFIMTAISIPLYLIMR
jgi:hypothetical protein